MNSAHGSVEIIGAIVVIICATQQAVAIIVTCRDNRIMDTGRSVFREKQDRAATVRIKVMALGRENGSDRWPRMFHRHKFGWIIRAERPCIANLMAVRIDDLNGLTF